MATPTCGFRAIDGTYHTMKPDCDRRNADIYAGRLPANLERGVARQTRPIEDEIIAADIASEEPGERDSFVKWIAIGAVMSLGAVAAGITAHIWRVL